MNIIAPSDAPVVRNLKKAGAIVVGLTNTPEFSFRGFTENPLHGLTLNPWDPDITCGGSSGGAGAHLSLTPRTTAMLKMIRGGCSRPQGGSCAGRIDATMKYRSRYPALTYFRQLCASLKPNTSRAFRFDSGAS